MYGEAPFWITGGFWDFVMRPKLQDPPLWAAIVDRLESLSDSGEWLDWWSRQTPLPLNLFWGIEPGSKPGRRQHSSGSYITVTSIFADSQIFDLNESEVPEYATGEVEAAIDYVVGRKGFDAHPPWPWESPVT